MGSKKSFRSWINWGVIWLVLAFVIPQTSSERSLHPFFNWFLFGGEDPTIKEIYSLTVARCKDVEYHPPMGILKLGKFNKGEMWRFHNRVVYLYKYLNKGDYMTVRNVLKEAIPRTLPELIGCEFVFYKAIKGIPKSEMKWIPISETKFEI